MADVFVVFFLHDLVMQPLVDLLLPWTGQAPARILVAASTFTAFFLLILVFQRVWRKKRRPSAQPRQDSLLHSVPFLIVLAFFATVLGILVSQILPSASPGTAVILGSVGCFVVAVLSRHLVPSKDSQAELGLQKNSKTKMQVGASIKPVQPRRASLRMQDEEP